ncbi:hypothetical protein [Kribbella ginsengisoli]|uniref:Uncharacterized protein n=1 Tax=Kribbella ginsengisoli TaxID=363865 RepID=A0ABP6WDG0_9ACTN
MPTVVRSGWTNTEADSATTTSWSSDPQDVHYRCVVVSELAGELAGFYSLDLPIRTFHQLPDISPAALVRFAHGYLSATEHIPLDASRQKTWDADE